MKRVAASRILRDASLEDLYVWHALTMSYKSILLLLPLTSNVTTFERAHVVYHGFDLEVAKRHVEQIPIDR